MESWRKHWGISPASGTRALTLARRRFPAENPVELQAAFARVVDTSTAKLAVDIGGASGTLVHSLMIANPGVILDLPHAVPSATAAASALGLAERSRAFERGFFRLCPRGRYLFAQTYSA